MPPEPSPFVRKERKTSSSDPSGIVPNRMRQPPTSPLQHNSHGSFTSRRWGGGGGASDFRRPVSGILGSHENKIEANRTLQSSSGDPAYCVTPRIADDASSHKKHRLGWGDGLAKYERSNDGPDDIVGTETAARIGMVDSSSRSESLLPTPLNLTDKSRSLTGVEEKATTMDSSSCNPHAVSCHLSQSYIEALSLNLGNLEGLNLSSLFDQLLQTDESSVTRPGFVKSTAMDKLRLWKAEIAETLEIIESEIDLLEDELKSSVFDVLKGDKLYNSILAANKVLAHRASDELHKIFPTKRLRNYIPRVANHSLIRKKVYMRNRFLKFKERVLALKFRAFRYSWKEDLRLLCRTRFGKSRLSASVAGSSNRFETREVVYHLKKLLSESHVRISRSGPKIPSYIVDRRERMTRFISDNGLVKNPVLFEKERSAFNPWTAEEKAGFMNKYYMYRKNFKKIASFLEHKTTADCIEFYYKNHKSIHFPKRKKKPKANTSAVSSTRSPDRPMLYSDWTDEEKSRFINAVKIYGTDFKKVSKFMRNQSSEECRLFYTKFRTHLGLYVIYHMPESEGNLGGGSKDDHEDQDQDAYMIHSESVISHGKSSLEWKTEMEELHSFDSREEHAKQEDTKKATAIAVKKLLQKVFGDMFATETFLWQNGKVNPSEELVVVM